MEEINKDVKFENNYVTALGCARCHYQGHFVHKLSSNGACGR